MGKVASRYTQKKLTGKYVKLEFEGNRKRGYYGRLLTYVVGVQRFKVPFTSPDSI
jgi:endonuclease YncB( thermonuclease family)